MDFKILELFSGIGGMHYAFKNTGLSGSVVAAVDINTVANDVYKFNYSNTPILNNNIQKLSVKTIKKLGANMILMSPPCQPHTRQGLQRDVNDNRSDALQQISAILPDCTNIDYVLMENVKCFEESQARRTFVEALTNAGFYYREFILSPTQFGIPNTRNRYYCVARKKKDFSFKYIGIYEEMPEQFRKNWTIITLEDLLDPNDELTEDVYLPYKVLTKRIWLMDIVNTKSKNTMCFTKAYTHYHEGTGSMYTEVDDDVFKATFKNLKLIEQNTEDSEKIDLEEQRFQLINQLHLRYFTPREVSRLMCFPDTFSFPKTTSKRQQYRLLGNSVNVLVVSELIKLLCDSC